MIEGLIHSKSVRGVGGTVDGIGDVAGFHTDGIVLGG